MNVNIKFKKGRCLVNDKQLSEMNKEERLFMDNFFREVKLKNMVVENFLPSDGN